MLKEVRIKSGYTQKQVAAKLGIAQNTYSAYETGRLTIPDSVLHKLAEFFKVGINDLTITPTSFDTLSENEQELITMLRTFNSTLRENTTESLVRLYSAIDNLDKDDSDMAEILMRQLFDTCSDLLMDYYTVHSFGLSGKVARKRSENARDLVKTAMEELIDFVDGKNRGLAPLFEDDDGEQD